MSSSAGARTSAILNAIKPQDTDLKYFSAPSGHDIPGVNFPYTYKAGTELEAEIFLPKQPKTARDHYKLALSFLEGQRSFSEIPTFTGEGPTLSDFCLHLLLDAAEGQYEKAKTLLGEISREGAHGLNLEDLVWVLVARGYKDYSLDVILSSLSSGHLKAKAIIRDLLERGDACGLRDEDLNRILLTRGYYHVKNRSGKKQEYFWYKGTKPPQTFLEFKACLQTLKAEGAISKDLILTHSSALENLRASFTKQISLMKENLQKDIRTHFNKLIAYAKAGNQELVVIDSEAILKSAVETELPAEDIQKLKEKLNELTRFKAPTPTPEEKDSSPESTPRGNYAGMFAGPTTVHPKILRPSKSRGISPTSSVAADLNLSEQENIKPNNEAQVSQQLKVF